MTEAYLVREIATALRKRGAVVYRTHGSMLTNPGVADLIVGYAGRYYELEVKLPGRYLSAVQNVRAMTVQLSGCQSAVVRSVEEAIAVIAGTKETP